MKLNLSIEVKNLSLFPHPQTLKIYFFLCTTISRELETIISLLKIPKAYRFLDVDAKFLKYGKFIILRY